MLSQDILPVAAVPGLIQDPKIKTLLAQSQGRGVKFYPADATIYSQGDPSTMLYMVEFGMVRICRVSPDGRRQITSFCLAGDVFGLEDGDEHDCSAESVDGTGVRVLCPANSAGFSQSILPLTLRRFAQMREHVLLLGRMSASEKMALFLFDLMQRQGGHDIIDLPMQRSDIADYLGITFETVSRVLRTFKESRIIRLNTISQIELLDPDALTEIAA